MDEQAKAKKRMAILELLGAVKLQLLGGSVAVILPKAWLEIYGWEVDGKYWVNLKQEGGIITISPVDRKEAKAMMEANDVRIC